MTPKDYDTTVARIAGNILSGIGRTTLDDSNITWAVSMARGIIAETKATEPVETTETLESQQAKVKK